MLLQRLAATSVAGVARRFAPPVGALTGFGVDARRSTQVWTAFKQRFIDVDGRVLDDDGSTHSEGLGTALLASATLRDAESFDRLWAFARTLRRHDGLFSWRVQRGGRVVDANNATDGDLYIAWALARAARAFGAERHAEDARRTARAVRTHCVRDTRLGPVLVPGRFGFDRDRYVVANPSYWVFPALAELARVDPHGPWRGLSETALALLARARFGRRKLVADWIEVGQDVRPWRERPARFGYEAIRVPLFLYWAGRFTHPQLAAFTRHAAAPAFAAWVALDSDETSRDRAPPGFEAIARLARALPALTPAHLPALNGGYYSSSLTLLAALANDDVLAGQRAALNAMASPGGPPPTP